MMNAICMVLALTLVVGGDPRAEEIGRFRTHQGCNEAIVANLDKYDRLETFDLDQQGRPLPRPQVRPEVKYLEGYRALAFDPYYWYGHRQWERKRERRRRWK